MSAKTVARCMNTKYAGCMNTTQPTPVSFVTVYGDFPSRMMPIAEVRDFAASRNVTTILGAMRPGYLGREVVTLDDIDRWLSEDSEGRAAHDTDAARLVALYDERIALAHRNAATERLTRAMVDEVLAKGAELDAACETFRRKHYPRKHHVIVGLRQVIACSRTRRSTITVYSGDHQQA